MDSAQTEPRHRDWLIRISTLFADFAGEIVASSGAEISRKLGEEYYLVRSADGSSPVKGDAARYIRWNVPVDHAWPCNPLKMDGFVEKAAQGILKKFGARNLQALWMGLLDPSASNRTYKTLGSNLRGRTIQLFPPHVGAFREAESQSREKDALFCMIGKEGLYCGVQSPSLANGFYPGGTKFISQSSPDTISRAGAKIAEALHYLPIHRKRPPKGAHWLELGASPGGMTSELLNRGYKVTALDRASLDKRLDGKANLIFAQMDVSDFRPNAKMIYDAVLCDMNGDARDAIRQIARLAPNLREGAPVIFTLKTPGTSGFSEMNELHRDALKIAAGAGLEWFASTHLSYNRQEFTMFFEVGRGKRG